jgi:hypothetical protein
MKRPSYSGALDEFLTPLGFVRVDSDWIRKVGDIEECVNLQKSGTHGGVTANLMSVDVKSSELWRAARANGLPGRRWWVSESIGFLFSQHSKWWKNDPGGPAELVEKVRDYGIPYLERMRDPVEQANQFGLKALLNGTWRQGPSIGELAVTLHRMGEHELVCRALDVPRRRHEIGAIVEGVRAFRHYFHCPPTENWPD